MGRKVRSLDVPLMKRRNENREITQLTGKVRRQQETIAFLLTKIARLEGALRKRR
jgi:hypothetical protein